VIISSQNPSKMSKSHRQFSLLESSTTTSSYRSSSDTFCDIGKNNQSEQPSGLRNHQQLTSPTLYEDDDSSYTFVLSDIPPGSTRNPRQPITDPARSYRSELSFRLPASPPPTSVTSTNLIDLGSPPQSPYIPGFQNFLVCFLYF